MLLQGVYHSVSPSTEEKWQDPGGGVHQPPNHQRGRVQGHRQEQGRVPDPGRAQDVQQVRLHGGGRGGENRGGEHTNTFIWYFSR